MQITPLLLVAFSVAIAVGKAACNELEKEQPLRLVVGKKTKVEPTVGTTERADRDLIIPTLHGLSSPTRPFLLGLAFVAIPSHRCS